MQTEERELDLQEYVEHLTEEELMGKLDFLTQRSQDMIRRGVDQAVFEGQDFPVSLIQETVEFIVNITTDFFPIPHFEVTPVHEGHLFNIHLHDEQQNTIADILFLTEYKEDKNQLSIEDVFVTFKIGAFVAPKAESDYSVLSEEDELKEESELETPST